MTTEREPFKFGQDANVRSMEADKYMLEHILTLLPENHDSRKLAVQDLENLNLELEKVKRDERNNSAGN
jgi:hypothetical protein